MSTDAIRTAEEAPLLFRADAHGPPPVFSETPLPSKAFRYKVISLCILFVFLIDLSGFLIEPPVQAIIEDVVCYIHYPDHRLAIGGGGGGGDTDPRCKSPDVQKMMTSVKAITIIPDFLFRGCSLSSSF